MIRVLLFSVIVTAALSANSAESDAEKILAPGDTVELADAPTKLANNSNTLPERDSEATQLREALAQTYLNNPSLEASRAAQRALDERVAQAVSGWRPSVNGLYEDGRQRTRRAGNDFSYSDTNTKQLTVSQPLFRGGQTFAAVSSAKAIVNAGQAQLRGIEQDILLQAVTAYMDVVRSYSIVELSQKNVRVLNEQQTAASQRFEVGEVTRTDVAQSKARLSQAKARLTNAEGDLAAAVARYREAIGEVPGSLRYPDWLPDMPASLAEALEIAKANNPLLQQAEYQRASADYDINQSIGGLLPSLSIEGTLSRQESLGFLGNSSFDSDRLVLNATVPLYQGGAQYSRVRQAKQTYQQRRFQALNADRQVEQQVISAWEQLDAARASVTSNADAIEAATIALDGVNQELQFGSRTTLDVLDAEQELFSVEVDYVQAQRNEVVAAFTLLDAIGYLSAQYLALEVPIYNPEENYDDVKYQFIGF